MDVKLLRESFAAVAPRAGELVEFFYGHLFYRGGPDVIDLFPPDMAYVRAHLGAALVKVIESADDTDALVPVLKELGTVHRKQGVQPQHFDLVGASLLATLAHFAGPAWTKETAASWAQAYGLVSHVMQQGIAEDIAAGNPPWWDATVVAREMRTYDIVMLSARLARPMTWVPGQSVPVRFDDGPPIWRPLTPANAPRATRVMDFHVKVIPGGMLSVPLALRAQPGTGLRIGPPMGTLALDGSSRRDILMIAGSTGLTPMLAILDRLGSHPAPPAVHLFFGARDPDGLYELERLAKLENELDWLTLTHAVEVPRGQAGDYEGEHGSIVDVATRMETWQDRDAYVCGPAGMVQAAAGRLLSQGVPGSQIHIENFGAREVGLWTRRGCWLPRGSRRGHSWSGRFPGSSAATTCTSPTRCCRRHRRRSRRCSTRTPSCRPNASAWPRCPCRAAPTRASRRPAS